MFCTIRRAVRGCWFFFWGHIFALFLYDRKYLTGRWFAGKLHGLCAPGWEWVTRAAVARIFTGINREARFPVSSQIRVIEPKNIRFHPDDLNNFQSFGNYYQAIGRIDIGRGTYIAPNVGLITANHTIGDLDRHEPAKAVKLGARCWVGMNAVILPGVELGDDTVVAAGAVVTKSFPEGNCVLAGSPAKIIKENK